MTDTDAPTGPGSLREFLQTETAGGLVLVLATAAALVWANSPWRDGYESFWHTVMAVEVGSFALHLDLRHWVNDGLMAIFFLVVAMEIKRELTLGELRDRRRAALPVAGAIGGMVVPALLYVAVNLGGAGARGWGIPMATDIAFALGVLALVAPRLPSSLRLFLLTLAIVDDMGAIVVIALFYSESLSPGWLGGAAVVVGLVVLLRRLGYRAPPLFVGLGVLLWLALHESGAHATLAGVAMGLLVPAVPAVDREIILSRGDELLDVFSPDAARSTSKLARQAVSELEWLEHGLHPWASLAIVPIFALANAGIELSAESVGAAVTSRIALGVVLGLVVGKAVGITGGAWLATRAGVAEMAPGVRWSQLAGVATLGGIGFTVSLFVTQLAWDDPVRTGQAKVGVLAASLLAAVVGGAIVRRTTTGTPG